jgi:citrate synthase
MDRTQPFDHPARLLAVLEQVGRDHLDLAPNVDMAIGAIAAAAGFTVDAGQTIATIARIAGWTAHVIEEFGERPLRYRTRGAYLE